MTLGVVIGAMLLNRTTGDLPVGDHQSPVDRESIRPESDPASAPKQAAPPELVTHPPRQVMEPFEDGKEPVDLPAGDLSVETPDFIMSAMTRGRAEHISVGIADPKTGRGDMLRPGDRSFDGWRFISADFDRETALFEKDGREYTAHLERGATTELALTQPADHGSPRASADPASIPQVPSVELPPPAAFSQRVYHVEGFEPVALSPVKGSPEFVEIKTGNETYALRLDIVEAILSTERLTTEERLRMMVAFPGLATVAPGQSASEQAAKAERQMAEILVPPTNTPPLEELHRLLEQLGDMAPSQP